MDPLFLARLQFAMTIGFHFIFPPVSIGLAWMVCLSEYFGWRRNDPEWERVGKFFGKLLAITFVTGVATGIVMEFQFGTNWARYSKFVGDIFGAPLAAEGVFAFFLESGFLGLYLFGRGRIKRGWHWFASFMVAVGSTLSAFWIIVANSWQQTPAGFEIRNGRAELTSFSDAVFNPSTLVRYVHTVDAAVIAGAFAMASVAAWHLLRDRNARFARKAMTLAVVVGLVASIAEAVPFGHMHAQQVARTQPEKFAAIEGLYQSKTAAPMALFAIPGGPPPELHAKVEIPGMLSWLAFGTVDAHVQGLDAFEPEDVPPLWLTFVSFHNMVVLGMFFILVMAVAAFTLWRGTLWDNRFLLKVLMWSVPLPVAACQLGWMAAEVGRQPWIVYKLLRTAEAHSSTVTAGEILFSMVAFGLVYLCLGALWLFLMIRKAKQGPEPVLATN